MSIRYLLLAMPFSNDEAMAMTTGGVVRDAQWRYVEPETVVELSRQREGARETFLAEVP